ncbi:DUF1684 domain-containing protein [Maribacter sp. MAR_2009_72]|uniref:DUF1684 domain-containing protein n=1 Tax=Maribacter sp. MAR_2009_72 TaxID=1250050 RepID=UPI00119954EE|nr:DUF1684 domain-containing protein [Maribacter sp. MAR_2009_72]TVZ15638.1 hypothetical protein JM81_1889 [Maribacter sp. MAR_2009_72]
MTKTLTLLIILQLCIANAQSYNQSVLDFQQHLNEEYKNPDESPLDKKDLKWFKGHDFFPINEKYRVVAKFTKIMNPTPFLMKTTTSRLSMYEVYGVANFELDGKEYQLNVYQNHKLRETEEYKNYLFLPFTDLTNGDQTYGGGRFIDLEIPEEETIVIDFNKAYNPYCAYSSNYSCPIPPKENDLDIHITAGIKK